MPLATSGSHSSPARRGRSALLPPKAPGTGGCGGHTPVQGAAGQRGPAQTPLTGWPRAPVPAGASGSLLAPSCPQEHPGPRWPPPARRSVQLPAGPVPPAGASRSLLAPSCPGRAGGEVAVHIVSYPLPSTFLQEMQALDRWLCGFVFLFCAALGYSKIHSEGGK